MTPAPTSAGTRPARGLAIAAAILIIASLIFTAAALEDRRTRALTAKQREIDNLALVLSRDTERVFEAAELVFRTTLQEVSLNPPLGGKSRANVEAILRARISGIPAIRSVTIISRDGTLSAASIPGVTGKLDQAPSFQFMRDSAIDGMYVWRLSSYPATGTFIPLTHRMTGIDGKFAGIIVVNLNPEAFLSLYRSIDLDPGDAVLLVRDDGAVTVSSPLELTPPPYSVQGPMVAPLLAHGMANKAERGTLESPADIQAFARRYLSRFPLHVEVRASRNVILASWRIQSLVIGGAVLVFAAAGLLLVWRMYGEVGRRQAAERQIAEQARLHRTVFDTVPHPIFVKDADGRYLQVNRAMADYWRMTPEQFKGQRIASPGARDQWEIDANLAEDLAVLTQGREISALRPTVFPDGQERQFHVTRKPLRDETGRITGLVGTAVDQTDRLTAEVDLRRSQALLRTVFDTIPLAVLVKDLDDRLLVVNPQTAARWGLPPEALIGKRVKDLDVPANERRTVEATDAQVIREDRILDYELERTMPDGKTRRLRAIKAPLHGPDGKVTGILGISEDITERHRTREEKAALERQLEQVQKMDTVGRLAGGVAHDFNNLLTPVIGFADLAMGRVGAHDPLRKDLEMIREAAGHAAELTRGLLSFSRSQVMTLRPVQLNDEIRSLNRMLSRVIGEGIEIVLNLDPALDLVNVDVTQMHQVLMNLAVNGRDAMPGGGKLVIESRNIDLDAGYAERILETPPGRYVMISVSDTGVGMSPEIRARIFEPFFTTKEVGKGTGLGLSIVYGIVRQHRGTIRVYSEGGQGTSFKLLLPTHTPGQEAVEATRRPLEHLRGSERILVVEDEARVRSAVCALLGSLGYDMLEAASPGDALSLLDDLRSTDVALLISDMVLPGQNGRELFATLKRRMPGLNVLFMSGYPRDVLTESWAGIGQERFIGKPFGLQDLAERVHMILERGPPA